MISSIVKAMIAYAKLEPKNAEKAIQLAKNAADYLLSISYPEGSALAGLPPTYSFKGLNKEIVDATAPAADGRKDTMMNIYPACAGGMYLLLEQETGDQKYFLAAQRIAQYYLETVQPNGSWYLLVSAQTGETLSATNYCATFDMIDFLTAFYQRTKQECWNTLQRNYFDYLQKTCLQQYNWEGQFEDIALSGNYRNLTHFCADSMIRYFVSHCPDDEQQIQEAEQLMRYVEDQFVVWGEFAPWTQKCFPGNPRWYSPACLEQYFWHVPIDSSTAVIMQTFLSLYSATKNPLLLEKACALGDAITRMQNPQTGVIPTHWMKEDCATNLENFWINCHIATSFNLIELAEAVGEI
ncbi:MAG: hypothetical protein IJC55_03700, partial [Clostridia bacterium]|nr:hypothetical protein [Clostridia bacterium]